MNEWIPIKEKRPMPYDDVLITIMGRTCRGGTVEIGYLMTSRNQFYVYTSGECVWDEYVSAWMPIPAPYTEN